MKFFALLLAIITTACADTVVVDQTLDVNITRQTGNGTEVTLMKNVGIRTRGSRFVGPVHKASKTFWVQFPLDDFLDLLPAKSESYPTEDRITFEVVRGRVFVYEKFERNGKLTKRYARYKGVQPVQFVLPSFNEKANRYYYTHGYKHLQKASETDTASGDLKKYYVFKLASDSAEAYSQHAANEYTGKWKKYVYINYSYKTLTEGDENA